MHLSRFYLILLKSYRTWTAHPFLMNLKVGIICPTIFPKNWGLCLGIHSSQLIQLQLAASQQKRHLFTSAFLEYKSNSVQYNTLVCWDKWLINQSSDVPINFFFHNFLQNSLQEIFQFIFYFLINLQKEKDRVLSALTL